MLQTHVHTLEKPERDFVLSFLRFSIFRKVNQRRMGCITTNSKGVPQMSLTNGVDLKDPQKQSEVMIWIYYLLLQFQT